MKSAHRAMAAGHGITRRRLLAGGGIAVLGAVVPAATLAATLDGSDAVVVDLTRGFSITKFRALLDQTFLVDTPLYGAVPVRLIRVRRATVSAVQPVKVDQFSVTFRGDLRPMPSGAYSVSHPTAGRVALYLEALSVKPGAATRYRADFNVLKVPNA